MSFNSRRQHSQHKQSWPCQYDVLMRLELVTDTVEGLGLSVSGSSMLI